MPKTRQGSQQEKWNGILKIFKIMKQKQGGKKGEEESREKWNGRLMCNHIYSSIKY